MTVLKARSITKIYGGSKNTNSTKALDGIDLTIDKGEFVGIMGPSGSGKTTLLNVLSGLNKVTAGSVEVEGTNISMMGKDEMALFRREKLGYVFQDNNLLDSLTLKENIMLPLVLGGKRPQKIDIKAEQLMTLLDIKDISFKYPYNISGGQQQRTAVARALINNPAIIFADEPTGNLDSKASKTIMQYMERINAEEERTILMVTHDPFTASYCKRIIFIKDGTIHMEINRKEGRKEFFDRILDCLAVLEGEQNDI